MSGHGTPIPMTSRKSGPLKGVADVPGDKSISHRSLLLGAMAVGETRVTGLLEGEDVLATAAAMRAFGADVERLGDGEWRVNGVGVGGFAEPQNVIDCGNAGTGVRLIMGCMATSPITATFTGDASLRSRPMGRVTDPIALFGAQSYGRTGGRLPMTVVGAKNPVPVRYRTPMASAQVKSAVLLGGLYAEGETSVTEPAPTRDHTERMLGGFGYDVRRDGATSALTGGGTLTACKLEVPADISSAAFFLVGASIAEGSELTLPHVGINPTRTGVIDILKLMGADIRLENQRDAGGEPVADIVVKSAPLKGIDIPEELVPLAIDEFPAIFIAAACAEGDTILRGAEELRVKESDRIQVMADGLAALGVDHEVFEDGIRISGGPFAGGEIQSHGDHRIAMSFAMASLRASGPITINDCANVATSFPGFAQLAAHAGLNLEVK